MTKAAQIQADAAQAQVKAAHMAVREAQQQAGVSELMLNEARNQTRLEVRPILVLEPHDLYQLQIRNVGRGPAFHGNVTVVRQPKGSIDFSTIQWIEASGREPIPFKAYSSDALETATTESGHRVDGIFELVRQGDLSRPIELQLTYKDLYGKTYTTLMQLDFDPKGRYGLHFIASDESCWFKPCEPASDDA